jgi:hypothetical protein
MKHKILILAMLPGILLLSCAREKPEVKRAVHITGNITVDNQLDASGDYSGIQLLSTITSGSQQADTLFYAVTDSTGFFAADALFEIDDIYPVLISRNRNTFGILNLVFADRDTININARLPNVNQTVTISSKENDLLTILNRIERNFTRVANFINAGVVAEDSIQIEIEKWSDLYWELFDENPGTYVGKISGENSVVLLRGWNNEKMLERSNMLLERYNHLSSPTRQVLAEFYAETEGINRVLLFLQDLEERSSNLSAGMEIQMERIELLFDSSRTIEANSNLDDFKEIFADNEMAMRWAESISFDIEFLAPGYEFPELTLVTTEGDTIRTQELRGRPFLLELTRFDNFLYQQQYDRTVAIHQIYRNFDLEIITVPLSASDVMLDAFFEERSKLWKIIQPNSFNTVELAETLNLNRLPTRFLVNSDGTIIRRYIGNEYDDVVQGLQQITTLNE